MPRLFVFFLLLFTSLPGFAQPEMANWYFGNKAGIRFLDDTVIALTDGRMVADEGCSTISDRQGRLLFYSNGVQVWGKDHQVLPNGSGLAGHRSSTQAALFVPHPGDRNLYYLFTTGAAEQGDNAVLAYSLIDRRLNNGNGDVVLKNQVLLQPTTEKLCGIRHANGRDVWVVGHEMGTDAFYAYLISPAGVDVTPVVSHAGSVHTQLNPVPAGHWANENAAGYMKASPNGNKIALAISEMEVIETLKFNKSTGIVEFELKLQINNVAPYGIEFSPDNNKLFVGYRSEQTGGNTSSILSEFNLSYSSLEDIINKAKIIKTADNSSLWWALQLGSDKNIYQSKWLESYLGSIPNPSADEVLYFGNKVNLLNKSCLNGLPNFINNFPKAFTASATCLNEPVDFLAATSLDADSVEWLIYDENNVLLFSSNSTEVSFTFSSVGSYLASIAVFKDGYSDTITQKINIYQLPEIDLGTDTLLFKGETLHLNPQQSNANYLWQDGSTNGSFTVSEPGTYWVLLTDQYGCTASDSIKVSYTTIKIPNIITPNTDGLNDAFVVEGIESYTWHLQIFNRWGRQVYFTEKYANNWTAEGLPAGIYYYALSNNRLKKHFKGWVQVVR